MESNDAAAGGGPTAVDRRPPQENPSLDLNELESETFNLLQKYGSPGAKSRKFGASPTISPPPSERGRKARPWTGVSAIHNRPCRTTGGIKSSSSTTGLRPFTSSSKKQVTTDNNNDDDERMFKADGTARNALRNRISSALSTSQFDSVPSLLASGTHSRDLPASPFSAKPSYMVSAIGVNKSSTPKKTAKGVRGSAEDSVGPGKIKSLALRDIKYTGFDKGPDADEDHEVKGDNNAELQTEVCFNCWSAGEGNKCLIHIETPRSIATDPGSNAGQNLSMCRNWNTSFLRRKYRSEAIQEQFDQTSQSLVFDRSQKQFSTLEQPKHPIYRLLIQHVARMNFTNQRRQNVKTWFQSFIKKLKDGNVQSKRSKSSSQILLLKSTIKSMVAVRKLSNEVRDQHPKAPVTGTTMNERCGKEQVLVEKVVTVDGVEETHNFVIIGPTPVPQALYRPRKYEPCSPTTFVLGNEAAVDNECSRLDFSSIMSSSVQYATFGRKRANENIAVGGLSAEMLVSRQFTGRFPPQYKNFKCKYEGIIIPPCVDEESPTFPTMQVPPDELPYIRRDLITPLDSRLPPTVIVKTGINHDDKHYFGINRPEQTGEAGDFGFRTSTWYSMPVIDDRIDTNAFRPSESIATPNNPVLSPMRKMKVDLTYPFCKEQSRMNCVEDLYHLLLSDGKCSTNTLQMFTIISSQQCGYYMQNGNSSLPIGRVITKVVRSWAFLQSETEEEAIYEEEQLRLGLGGVVLRNRPRHARSMPRGALMSNNRKDVRNAILRRMPSEEDALAESKLAPLVVQTIKTEQFDVQSHTDPPVVPSRARNGSSKSISVGRKTSSSPPKEENSVVANVASEVKPLPFATPVPEEKPRNVRPATAPVGRHNGGLVAESISQVIGDTLKSFSNKPEDLIRLGMGIGASLGAQGFLDLQRGAEQEHATNDPILNEEAIEVPTSVNVFEEAIDMPTAANGDQRAAHELDMNDMTFQSCSSEESKLDFLDNDHAVENNIINFADITPAPQGLLDIIAATRVGAKRVDYLPYTFSVNLPVPRNIDPLKPRSTCQEWKEINYDPWSADKPPTSSTFIRSLTQETKNWPKPVNRTDGPEATNTSKDFKTLCTLCRHGKYRELEEMINNPTWSLPIDYCDDSGNTLLMIACQNGNKRIAKLCLRRGSQINNQNLNGNSCLHFAFGYGFEDLGQYLISKGADDSLLNSQGLTCWEGIDMDSADN